MKSLIKILGIVLILQGMLICCEKEPTTKSTMAIRIQDHPGKETPFEEVNIHISQVQVFYENGTWANLKTESDVYNILALRDNKSAFIVRSQQVDPGSVVKIRIIPGSRNSVKMRGQLFPLAVETADQNGMDFGVTASLKDKDIADILLGFDAVTSVAVDGLYEYRLRPKLEVLSVVVRKEGTMPK